MTYALAFFSLIEMTDPAQHRAYNEWHQLDHLPENRALPGVAWGERWARPAEYRAAGTATGRFAEIDYLAMYLFREPAAQSLAEWDRLGAESFQWGRGPMLPGIQRRMLSFFTPVKGYAAPEALVSADVLPLRPNRGVHVELTRHARPFAAETHERFAWEDRVLMPRLLGMPGVAGAWTFAFDHHQRHSTLPLGTGDDDERGSLRLRLTYLDGDPLETAERMRDASGGGPEGGEVLLSSPLRRIIPWQDW